MMSVVEFHDYLEHFDDVFSFPSSPDQVVFSPDGLLSEEEDYFSSSRQFGVYPSEEHSNKLSRVAANRQLRRENLAPVPQKRFSTESYGAQFKAESPCSSSSLSPSSSCQSSPTLSVHDYEASCDLEPPMAFFLPDPSSSSSSSSSFPSSSSSSFPSSSSSSIPTSSSSSFSPSIPSSSSTPSSSSSSTSKFNLSQNGNLSLNASFLVQPTRLSSSSRIKSTAPNVPLLFSLFDVLGDSSPFYSAASPFSSASSACAPRNCFKAEPLREGFY